VAEVISETQIAPDHIYVIQPNTTLTIARDGERLQIAKPVARRGLRTPIDSFLISLAEAKGENAACVILSGQGATARSACARSRSMAA
jgi:two-component system, chemotaxis family, CheB/CheR fusion protein